MRAIKAHDGNGHATSHNTARAVGGQDASSPLSSSSPSSGRKRGRPRGSCNKAKLAATAAAAAAGRAAVAAGIDSLLSATALATNATTADGGDAASRREQLLKLVADSIVSGGHRLAAATAAAARQPRRCGSGPTIVRERNTSASRGSGGQYNRSHSSFIPAAMMPLSNGADAARTTVGSVSAADSAQQRYGSAPMMPTSALWNGCYGAPPSGSTLHSIGKPQNDAPAERVSEPASSMMPSADIYGSGQRAADPQMPPEDTWFWDCEQLPMAADDSPWGGYESSYEDSSWVSGGGALRRIHALAPPPAADVNTEAATGGNRGSGPRASMACSEDQQLQSWQRWTGGPSGNGTGEGGSDSHPPASPTQQPPPPPPPHQLISGAMWVPRQLIRPPFFIGSLCGSEGVSAALAAGFGDMGISAAVRTTNDAGHQQQQLSPVHPGPSLSASAAVSGFVHVGPQAPPGDGPTPSRPMTVIPVETATTSGAPVQPVTAATKALLSSSLPPPLLPSSEALPTMDAQLDIALALELMGCPAVSWRDVEADDAQFEALWKPSPSAALITKMDHVQAGGAHHAAPSVAEEIEALEKVSRQCLSGKELQGMQ